MSMLNMYPRHQLELQLQASSVDDAADDENNDVDHHGGASFGYGIAVVCVTIFVFCVLVSSSFGVWKACASAALTALLLIVAGCFAPKGWFRHRSQRPAGASAELAVTVTAGAAALQVNVPPAFAFECQPALEAAAHGGEREPAPASAAASCVVCCSVCLEDVRGGEMVRRLQACGHIFHVECIDMWLRSHRTCPMCRCVISPVAAVTPKSAAEEAPESSDDDHDLPPV